MTSPKLRYACRQCGTWICSACGGKRANTDIHYVKYPCQKCWGLEGTLVPTMHTEKMWAEHNEGPLPTPYPYGAWPLEEDWGPGFGARSVPQPRYRGVPVPVGEVDVQSFMRGVDSVLDGGEGR
jgi:hypothetical protein